MSTVLHSDSLLTHGSTNPFISFNGGFTPWEKLESFFTSTDKIPKPTLHKRDQSKPNLSCYHAGLVLDSESSNQKLPYHTEPNLSSYHVGLDLDLESPNNKIPPSFDKPNISRYYAESNLGSEIPNQYSPDHGPPNQNSPISSSSSGGGGLDDPNQNPPDATLNSFQEEPVHVASSMDERKRKRMVSNRESARRSRVRKQRHVENLRNNMNELKIQTRERSNQLRVMTHQINLVRRENDRLKAESIILQRNLMQLNQIWQLQQLQQQCSYHHHHHPPPPPATSCTPMQIIL